LESIPQALDPLCHVSHRALAFLRLPSRQPGPELVTQVGRLPSIPLHVADQLPTWNPGDEFRPTRVKQGVK
jgi:hypothetical protein